MSSQRSTLPKSYTQKNTQNKKKLIQNLVWWHCCVYHPMEFTKNEHTATVCEAALMVILVLGSPYLFTSARKPSSGVAAGVVHLCVDKRYHLITGDILFYTKQDLSSYYTVYKYLIFFFFTCQLRNSIQLHDLELTSLFSTDQEINSTCSYQFLLLHQVKIGYQGYAISHILLVYYTQVIFRLHTQLLVCKQYYILNHIHSPLSWQCNSIHTDLVLEVELINQELFQESWSINMILVFTAENINIHIIWREEGFYWCGEYNKFVLQNKVG